MEPKANFTLKKLKVKDISLESRKEFNLYFTLPLCKN